MAFTNVNSLVDRLVEEFKALGRATRFIGVTWSSGDLPLRNLDEITRRYAVVAQTIDEIQEESATNRPAADAAFARVGGPATVPEFNTKWTAIRQAGSAWITFLEGVYQAQPVSSLIRFEMVTLNGVTVPVQRGLVNLPGASALTLQNSTELANLRAALQDIGVANA